MALSDYVNTFGQHMLRQYGERVHKITINAGFTCPNRDGSKGIGGCTFCNNSSFNPGEKQSISIPSQLNNGKAVISRRTGAQRYLAYFQAYTNTYADVDYLAQQYEQALAEDNIIGLSIGTRPDCVPDEVLDLLCYYRDQGHEVWLELGLQSSHDKTLEKINRGHGLAEYIQAIKASQTRNLPVCTHLILGLPGETYEMNQQTLMQVIDLGVEGLKLHPLHVVKGTQLARQWKNNDYEPLQMDAYIERAVNLIELTPADIIYHRVTGTAQREILLAPDWCCKKWAVINGIEAEFKKRNTRQGTHDSNTKSQDEFLPKVVNQ
ncbi:MAG: TIGR01212 family radical SAM protein [Gammaproteobacteria bacterium]|nr:TIGR01212 family radical SAM protein [Gammaproteobacteria bacterium]